MRNLIIYIFAAVLMMAAQQAVAMTATNSVMKEITVTAPDGTITKTLVPTEGMVPGDTAVHTIRYLNDNDAPVENFKLEVPVPKDLSYVEGSAKADGAISEFSVDGGKTYAARSALKVRDANGQIRAASSGDITHVRWIMKGAVAPGQAGELTLKGKVR